MGHTEVTPPFFAISRTQLGATTRIGVCGELDVGTARELEAEIRDVRISCSRLVLDLTELTFIDSVGISVLLDLKRWCEGRRLSLYVIPSRDNSVTRVFAMTGTERELI